MNNNCKKCGKKLIPNQKCTCGDSYFESYSNSSFWGNFILFELIGVIFDVVFSILGSIFSDTDV